MKLIAYYDEEAGNNPYFIYIYDSIFKKLKAKYPEYNIEHVHPIMKIEDHCLGCPGGGSHYQIINPDNNKTILMSLWDRGMDVFLNGLGWEKYDIVQYIGGLGMKLSSKQIKEQYNIEHFPYQYPLGMPNAYDYIEDCKKEYVPEQKIKKAIFIGSIYGARKVLYDMTKNHPLIEIIDTEASYYRGKEYYEKISQYAIALSLNGNGELCMRDLESMGLNIPMVRSELLTQFYNPLIPNVHYIKASEPCDNACCDFLNINHHTLAEQFVDTIETSINDYDKLRYISNNGSQYYENYCKPDYLVNLFLELLDINKLF